MASVRKVQCVVESVTDHGGRVYTVRLEPQSRLPRFSCGQFLHLALDEYDPSLFWPESRVFSIASSPDRNGPLEILYSVKGVFTGRMECELKPGKEVWVKLPYGEFRFDDPFQPRTLCAGGTGISAFSSLLKAIVETGGNAPVKLFYGIREMSLFFYRDVVDDLIKRDLCDSVTLFVENGELPDPHGRFFVHPGRINLQLVAKDLSLEIGEHYLAGPPAMIDAIDSCLRERGVPDSRIIVDKWE